MLEAAVKYSTAREPSNSTVIRAEKVAATAETRSSHQATVVSIM